MLELALHVLDICENSIRAGATLIEIAITEDTAGDLFSIEICDNGSGMSPEALSKAMDPFYTTKKVRRVGLGLPMLEEAARRAEGAFQIKSGEGSGTRVFASFRWSHVDRQPLGNIGSTLAALLTGNPDRDFVYRHTKDGSVFNFDTREIRKELDGMPLNRPEVIKLLRENVEENLEEIGADFTKEDKLS